MPGRSLLKAMALLVTLVMTEHAGFAQHISSLDRERALVMLQTVGADVRKYYYDAKLHGVNWDAKVSEAKEKIAKATSYNEAVLDIAALLETLDDSHTSFAPPSDPIPQEYGWRFQMVGARCFVTHVQPKSDAELKGVKPGDEILTLNGFAPTRGGLPKMEYALFQLVPQSSLRLDLRSPSGKISHVEVKAKVRQARRVTDLQNDTGRDAWSLRLEEEDERRLTRPQYRELSNGLMILKLPLFDLTAAAVDEIIRKARNHDTLIVDVRGNPGGAEHTLQDLLGGLFEKEVKIANRVTRESPKPVVAKPQHNVFTGKLIVLVDSNSASASELLARVVQIERRGIVMGDRTSGSVMEAKFYSHRIGSQPYFYYGTEISEADLVMTDGNSLEHTGVIPDEAKLPVATDLANKLDPVLAHAAETAGAVLTPEQGGSLFPFEWPKR